MVQLFKTGPLLVLCLFMWACGGLTGNGGFSSPSSGGNISDDNPDEGTTDATRPTPGFAKINITGVTDEDSQIVCEDADGNLTIADASSDGSFAVSIDSENYYTVTFNGAPLTFDSSASGSNKTGIFYAPNTIESIDLGDVEIADDMAIPAKNPLATVDSDGDGISDLDEANETPVESETGSAFSTEAVNTITPATTEDEETGDDEPVVEEESEEDILFREEREVVLAAIEGLKTLSDEMLEMKNEVVGILFELKNLSPGNTVRQAELTTALAELQDELAEKRVLFWQDFLEVLESIKAFKTKWNVTTI